jgi:hypothetical protein
MLSDKIEQTIVKLCQDVDTSPIKTKDFECTIVRNIVFDFIQEMYMSYSYKYNNKVSSTDLCNFQNNMQNLANTVAEDFEMIIEKNKIDDFSHLHRIPFMNSLTEISQNFINDWIEIGLNYDFDFTKLEKYDLGVQQHFMIYYFKRILKIVLEYKNMEIIDLVNEHLKKMNINELLNKSNLDLCQVYLIKNKYCIEKFVDLNKFKDFAKEINNYLIKIDYVNKHKFINYVMTNEENKLTLKSVITTINYLCKMSVLKEFQDPNNKIVLKNYINEFGKAITTINRAYQQHGLKETLFISQFITKTLNDANFNYVFDDKLLAEAVENLQDLPKKGLIFIRELCNYALFNKFDAGGLINTNQYTDFINFINSKVKLDLCLFGEEYKKFLNDVLNTNGKKSYKTSEPLAFDIHHKMEIFDFINGMNKFNYNFCYIEPNTNKTIVTKDKVVKDKIVKDKIVKDKVVKEKVVKDKVVKVVKVVKEKVVKEKVVKVVKEKIPLPVKHALWAKYFGDKMNGVCLCCKTSPIHSTNFDCGHIESEYHGGAVHLDNLKPICRICNSSMGTQNMNEYMKKYGFDKLEMTNK